MNNTLVNAVLIINPLASPAYLNEKFKNAGYVILTCFTNAEVDYLIKPSLDAELYDFTVFLTKDFGEDIKLINDIITEHHLNIVLAFSSSEYDLVYSDKLAHHFCPHATNSPDTALWRCNKRFMNTRLTDNGTPATKQTLISTLDDIHWDELEFPLVIKPAEGASGSIGVLMCYTPDDLKAYFNDLDNKKWAHCFLPKVFLLEELLVGEEYIIDMVAWGSEYHLIGIYYAEKEVYGGIKICRHREFLNHNHPIAKQLFEYCSTVLKNLDVNYGMMHLECMLTQDGPRLIELNPRVSGVSGMLNYFSEALTGEDQASCFINLMRSQGKIAKNNNPQDPKYGVVFYLQNFGFKYDKINEPLFREVPSYQRHLVKIPHQPEKSYPQNLFDTVAFVILVGDSEAQVNNDLNTLKKWEAAGVFFE